MKQEEQNDRKATVGIIAIVFGLVLLVGPIVLELHLRVLPQLIDAGAILGVVAIAFGVIKIGTSL